MQVFVLDPVAHTLTTWSTEGEKVAMVFKLPADTPAPRDGGGDGGVGSEFETATADYHHGEFADRDAGWLAGEGGEDDDDRSGGAFGQ